VDAIADGSAVTGHEPIRVVHVASGDGWGGAERVIVQLVEEALHSPDVVVEALLFNDARLANTLRALGAPVHIIPEGAVSFPTLARQVRRWLAARRFDVVHAHRYKEILVTVLALAPRRGGFVVTVHGLEPSSQLTWAQLPRVWGALLAAVSLGGCLVAVSQELQRRLSRTLGKRHVTRISNPMPRVGAASHAPDLRVRLGWERERPVVGFVGRLEHVKGPDRFVEMAGRHGGDAGFVLIGGGSLEPELRARIAALGASERVAFLGEVPDASGYMEQLDVLAIPSRHEGLPLVTLEAAASEVPVVAFDVGGISEVLDGGPAARLIAAGDENAFLAAVEAILADRSRVRSEAVRWASAVRSRFEPSAIWSKYKRVYGEVVAASSGRRHRADGLRSTG
jgi:glycosyltransferase involved in cell wall biosynthesis